MKDKNDIDRLFVSYLLKELNTEEEDYVLNSIKTDSQLRQYFEEFQNLWKLLDIKQNIDGINIDEERKHLEEMLKEKHQKSIPVSEKPYLYNVEADPERNKTKIFRFLRRVAVAAAVLLMMGIFWLLFPFNKEKDPHVAVENKIGKENVKPFVRNERNISGKTRLIRLGDGSEVLLWDKSELSFTEPFADDKRDINLIGKARFKVAKDKTKPFTVFSGDINTTALGTEFIVTNFEKHQTITVRLLEGKVVVKSADGVKTKLSKPVYLLPGQELLYNKRNATAKVRNFYGESLKKEFVDKKDSSNENPFIPENYTGSWYMFNNQSLPDIFDQLESMFGVEIVYKRKDIQSLYFIGKFDKSDSLEYILKKITTINKLTLLKDKNKFMISQ
ncbi:MAG: FecR family protein [Chitinophagaceae bacterium]